MLLNGLAMKLCSIPLIPVPPIMRMISVELFHEIITISFCENTGRRYGGVFSVTFNHAFVYDLFIRFKTIAIDQQSFRNYFQVSDGEMHSHKSRLQDIHLVDDRVIDLLHRKANAFFFDNRA